MSRVTISMKAARQFLDAWSHPTAPWQRELDALIAELRRAMEPKRKPRKPLRGGFNLRKRQARQQKRELRASVREALVKRADGICECGCGLNVLGMIVQSIPQVDHMFGRGRGRLPESEETCWLLRADCHRDKTNNHPDAATWWRKFSAHLQRNGLERTVAASMAFKRLQFVETRSMLGAGLKERKP